MATIICGANKTTQQCAQLSGNKYLMFQNGSLTIVRDAKTIVEANLGCYIKQINEYAIREQVIPAKTTSTVFSGENVISSFLFAEYEDPAAVSTNHMSYMTNDYDLSIVGDVHTYTNIFLTNQAWKPMSEMIYIDAPSYLPITDLKVNNPTSKEIRLYSLYSL